MERRYWGDDCICTVPGLTMKYHPFIASHVTKSENWRFTAVKNAI